MNRAIAFCALLVMAPLTIQAEFQFVEDLTPPGGELEDFGLGAAIFGNELFVAWPHGFGNPAPALACGEVHYYRKGAAGKFEIQSVLQAPNCIPGDMFGASNMALDGNTLVVPAFSGLRGDGQGSPANSRLLIFERDDGYAEGDINAGWRPRGELTGSRVGSNRAIGGKVQIQGDLLAAQSHVMESAFGFRFARADGIYLFRRQGETWSEIAHLTESTDFFGFDFELTADQLIVGAPEAQTFGGAGKVLVYDRSGDVFSLRQTLTAGPERNVGYFLTVDDNLMAVGAVNLAQPGAVFLFERDAGGNWQAAGKLTPPVRANNDLYGVSGRLVDDLLVIGAENGLRQSAPSAGKVYVYRRSGADMAPVQELVAPLASTASDVFGGAVLSNGTDLFVKAVGTPAGGVSAFYHFQRETPPSLEEPFEITLGHSGLFYNPERSGEGFMIDTLPDGRGLMLWFTYHEAAPMWLLAIGPIEDNTMFLNEVFTTRGGRFGPAFDQALYELISWGSMVLEFDDCDNGKVWYFSDLGFGDGSFELSRLSNIAGLRCGETRQPVINGFSGGFFNPSRAGEGLQVHITDMEGEWVPVVYWPTYDTDGNQLWLFGMGRTEGDSILIDELQRFDGASFGNQFDSADVTGSRWGSARIDFDGCDDLTINYQSDLVEYGSGGLAMTRLYQLGQTTCNGSPSQR
ncbi:MAG: hypothetical protein EA370_05585 [Wenzhouxiangella sp.]|nr:MAG: hypothetical protein EA370_05585 [Wenzhouxiangella sp.]